MSYTQDELSHLLALQEEHRGTPPERILLGKGGYPPELRRALALQLASASTLAKKLPSWSTAGVFLPSSLALEQCSSELTAHYKQRFVSPEDTLLDLTGGLGVDFWGLASVATRAIYVEQQEALVEAARFNLPRLLPHQALTFIQGQSLELLPALLREHRPSLLFLDPARREGASSERRVYAIEDCEPDLLSLLPRLRQAYDELHLPPPRLLVKLSPMLDLQHTLRQLPETSELHLTVARGEVKELLLLLDLTHPVAPSQLPDVTYHVADLRATGESRCDTFPHALATEASLPARYASALGAYLFEPNAGLMKTGLFRSIGTQLGMLPLHPNTHLYTSDTLPTGQLPGRLFAIRACYPFASSLLKRLGKELGAAQISCRNFPLRPEELRAKLRLKESDQQTLFGTTAPDGSPILLRCERLS